MARLILTFIRRLLEKQALKPGTEPLEGETRRRVTVEVRRLHRDDDADATQDIVRQHGSRLEVSIDRDRGTVFTIILQIDSPILDEESTQN